MNRNSIIVAVIIILIAFGAGFLLLSNQQDSDDSSSSETSSESSSSVSSSITSIATSFPNQSSTSSSQPAEEVNISISMNATSFSQTNIQVEAGSTVNLTIENTNGLHDFNIDLLGVASPDSNTGETLTVSFSISEDMSGQELEFYCSYHRVMGMTGTLVIL
jgi:plastocyanin